jgi:hypothetical protein
MPMAASDAFKARARNEEVTEVNRTDFMAKAPDKVVTPRWGRDAGHRAGTVRVANVRWRLAQCIPNEVERVLPARDGR